MSATPQVSVITVTLNRAAVLEGCLDSVVRQEGVRVEHIVIDGGSTDGSVELLESRSLQLAYWESVPDGGIAQALNKGLRHVRGEWVMFLHSDDFLHSADALSLALRAIDSDSDSDSDCDVAAFPILFGQAPDFVRKQPGRPGMLIYLKFGLCHQGMLTRSRLFRTLGCFDERFRIDMDYEFYLRAYRAEAVFRVFSKPVLSVMRDTGLSSRRDWSSLRQRFAEERAIHATHAQSKIHAAFYGIYWHIYLPYRRLRAKLERFRR